MDVIEPKMKNYLRTKNLNIKPATEIHHFAIDSLCDITHEYVSIVLNKNTRNLQLITGCILSSSPGSESSLEAENVY